MKYRKLGRTGLDVSVLGFGASSLGSVFRETDDSEGIRTVHAAMDAGINLIDVSPYYGLTKAETVLGEAIRQLTRGQFILSTKAGRYGENDFDFTSKRIIASIDESLKRLQTDYVDILFLHDIEFVPASVVMEEALPALQLLKEKGKIRFGGICGLPLQLFDKLLPQIEVDAIISYCHYSLNDQTLTGLLPLLDEEGIGLINASPLSMGLLGSRGAPSWHPASTEIREACRRAAEYCTKAGTDIAKLAVQFSTSNEQIPTTLVSTANPDNIQRNAAWSEEPLDQTLLAEVLKILEPVQGRTWTSGRPEYNEGIR
ncbi:Predicted oxidoreductase [Paenibacillus sp. cl141a]|uniref:aldo/keto reductase n=1 Tax=Paenibacillus sp. cl141a TaxID=1761877 RepID=UPI0008ABC56F|nr:aldo/keto reductase [Paenibacillus sp. cl141a]SEK94423.1 Predicted oxidoreductase [Paenibacillus sp. cl141a]